VVASPPTGESSEPDLRSTPPRRTSRPPASRRSRPLTPRPASCRPSGPPASSEASETSRFQASPSQTSAGGSAAREAPAASGDSAAPLPRAQLERLLRRAKEFIDSTTDVDHYRALGVSRDASDGTLRRAFFELARTYHPDNFFRRVDAETLVLLEQAYQRVTVAYGVLSKPERRIKYDTQIGKTGRAKGESEAVARRRLAEQIAEGFRNRRPDNVDGAQRLYLRARKAHETGDTSGALRVLALVLKMDPFHKDARALKERLEAPASTRKD